MKVEKILREAARQPSNVRFQDLHKVCGHYFGEPRVHGSHHVFKTPWPGDPRINIQSKHGMAAAYQVRQVLAAIDRLDQDHT